MTTSPSLPTAAAGTLIAKRYEVEGLLGQGGGGTVYRVLDQRHGRQVRALKILSAAPTRTSFVASFKNEFQLLAAMEHEHIARVYEFGKVEDSEAGGLGSFYYTSEFVPGVPLFAALENLSTEQAIDLVVQIGDALAYLHDNKIVHRDLKSQNILVLEAGGLRRIKLLDFGIASRLGLFQDQRRSGTLAFMAPEILNHLPYDTRADLYSFGVILFYAFTKELPYSAESILHRLPPPTDAELAGRLSQASPEIVPIVLRLLRRDPEERYFSITQVLEDLRTASRVEPSSVSSSFTSPRMPFVGRKSELGLLREFYEATILQGSSVPRCCVLLGEPGIGKTRLLEEFQRFLQLDDLEVNFATVPKSDAGDNLITDRLSDNLNARRAFLIDDAQNLAESEHAKLLEIAKGLQQIGATDSPILVFAWSMPNIGQASDNILHQMPLSSEAFFPVRMEPLTILDVRHLLGRLYPQRSIPAFMVATLHRLTAGNPLLISDTLAAFKDGALLSEITQHEFEDVLRDNPVLESVKNHYAERVRMLPRLDQAILEVLAVVGEPCASPRILELLRTAAPTMDPAQSAARLRALTEDGLISRDLLGQEMRYSLRHPVLGGQIIRAMPDDLRCEIHREIARLLKEVSGDGTHLDRRAFHLAEADDQGAAFSAYLAAAKEHEHGGRLQSAILSYENALENISGNDRVPILQRLAALTKQQGHLVRSKEYFLTLQGIFSKSEPSGLPLLELYCELAELEQLLLQPTQALEETDKARALARSISATGMECRIAWIRGRALIRLGRYDDVLKESAQALGLSPRPNDKADILYNTALAKNSLGRFEEAVADMSESVETLEIAQSALKLSYALNGLGFLWHQHGNYAKAKAYYLRAYEISSHLGEYRYAINFLNNLATIDHLQLDFVQAEANYERAVELAVNSQQLTEKARILKNLGVLYREAGHFAKSERMLKEALAIVERAAWSDEAALIHRLLGTLFLDRGELSQAKVHLETSERASSGNVEPGHAHLLFLTHLGLGDVARAREYLDRLERTEDVFADPQICFDQHRHWAQWYLSQWLASAAPRSESHLQTLLLHLQEAESLIGQEKRPRALWEFWYLKGTVLRAVGDSGDASRLAFLKSWRLLRDYRAHLPESIQHYFRAIPSVRQIEAAASHPQNVASEREARNADIGGDSERHLETVALSEESLPLNAADLLVHIGRYSKSEIDRALAEADKKAPSQELDGLALVFTTLQKRFGDRS